MSTIAERSLALHGQLQGKIEHRLEGVQLQLAGLGGHGDGHIVAHDQEAGPAGQGEGV